MAATVIVAGARTPMGSFNGALSSVSATELGGSPSGARCNAPVCRPPTCNT